MTNTLRHRPEPTWQGFLEGEQREAAITALAEEATKGNDKKLSKCKAEIEGLDNKIRETAQFIADRRRELAGYERGIVELTTLLSDGATDAQKPQLAEDLQAIADHPNVLGMALRDDSLVVHIRATTEQDGVQYFLGDFEVCVVCNHDRYDRPRSGPNEPLHVYCTKLGTIKYHDGWYNRDHYGRHPAFYTINVNHSNGTAYGTYEFVPKYANDIKVKQATGQFAEMLFVAIGQMNIAYEGFTLFRDYFVSFSPSAKQTKKSRRSERSNHIDEISWQGFLDDEGTNRAIDIMTNAILSDTDKSITLAQDSVHSITAEIDRLTQNNNTYRTAKSEKRAELRRLQAIADGNFDTTAIVYDLDYIAKLPGVVGIKLEEGKVIVHYRNMGRHDGKFYDMGDYEITLNDDDGGLSIACTRLGTKIEERAYDDYGDRYLNGPQPRYLCPPYYEGVNIDHQAGTATGSFCFGNRTAQVWAFKYHFAYGEMIHLIINCMSSVNEGSEELYEGRFVEIIDPEAPDQVEPEVQIITLKVNGVGLGVCRPRIL